VAIVGVGRVRRRPELDGLFEAVEPTRMMVEALERAVHDAGDPAPEKKADYIGTVSPLAWGYANTPSVLAELLGAGSGLRHEFYRVHDGYDCAVHRSTASALA